MAITGYYHVTPTGAGAKTGLSWAAAMDEAAFEAFVEGGGVAAGNVIFVAGGTYTLDSTIAPTVNGTAVSPICVIGVKAGTTNVGAAVVYSDWSRASADRPYFDLGAWLFGAAGLDMWQFRNLFIEGSANLALCLRSNGIPEMWAHW